MASRHSNSMRLFVISSAAKHYVRSTPAAISITLLSLAVCAQGSLAQSAPTVTDPNAEQQQHPEAYRQLNRQIYGRREDPGSGSLNSDDGKMLAVSKQLNSMISREIEGALTASKPSAENIVASISSLQGSMSLTAWGPTATNLPFARFFSLNGIQTAAISYVIMQGGGAIPDTQPYLVFYDTVSGNWVKKAAAPDRARQN